MAKINALNVKAARDGFRRAGREWSREVTTVKLSDLSKEQIRALKEEPNLMVAEVEIDELKDE